MKPVKLLQHIALYTILARFRFKKDIPNHITGQAIPVSFGLWGVWYVVKGLNGLVATDGREIPYWEFRFTEFGHWIGLRDAEAARGTPMAEAWRTSCHEKINDRLNLHHA